jgi:hypothetical protein
MKFPEASAKDKEDGWKISLDFLKKIGERISKSVDMEFLNDEIEVVLLAAQQALEEREKAGNPFGMEK